MSSVNSVRIPGLATGMDTDQMIKDMLTGDQSKIDKAEQKKQTQEWQQEIYRDVIKDVKGLYDKYFTITSADSILSSKTFSTMTVNSSNNNVITATASSGASDVNYKFKVEKLAETAKLESKVITKDEVVVENETTITINDTEIKIEADSKVSDVIKAINSSFKNGEVKASYSEMTGKLTIETKESGSSAELKFKGEFFTSLEMKNNNVLVNGEGNVKGSNNLVKVFAADGVTDIKTISSESNSFTIDNITYKLNGTSNDLVSMNSTTDTQKTVDKVKTFVDDFNKMMDNIYDLVTQKKNNDYPPLTKSQKEEMEEEEIKRWEEKAKAGILRNDKELRKFMDEVKGVLFAEIEDLGVSLSDIGITSDSNYNKPGQIALDEDKFKKSLEDNSDLVYKAFTTGFEKIKTITYNYAGSSSSVFAKKAGIEKTSTAVNNLFSEQIRKQEEYIKKLVNKMQEKEESLYKKFAALESNMNKFNSQMNYLMSQ